MGTDQEDLVAHGVLVVGFPEFNHTESSMIKVWMNRADSLALGDLYPPRVIRLWLCAGLVTLTKRLDGRWILCWLQPKEDVLAAALVLNEVHERNVLDRVASLNAKAALFSASYGKGKP